MYWKKSAQKFNEQNGIFPHAKEFFKFHSIFIHGICGICVFIFVELWRLTQKSPEFFNYSPFLAAECQKKTHIELLTPVTSSNAIINITVVFTNDNSDSREREKKNVNIWAQNIIDTKLLCHAFIIIYFFCLHSEYTMNWCECVCVRFFSSSICVLSLRISLTHCVVSRSTSVIIITLALYFIWHAASSSPLDTFFCCCFFYSRISF